MSGFAYDLRAAINGDADTISMQLDGVNIPNLKDRSHLQTTAFDFTIPADNLFNAIAVRL